MTDIALRLRLMTDDDLERARLLADDYAEWDRTKRLGFQPHFGGGITIEGIELEDIIMEQRLRKHMLATPKEMMDHCSALWWISGRKSIAKTIEENQQ